MLNADEPITSAALFEPHVVRRSKFIEAVSSGWPHILASLKSLLETGESLEETREWPREAYG
jgi:hypothetical protein